MADTSGFSKHHGILIGIDAYPTKPLLGASRDVRNLAAYLSSLSNPANPEDYQILSAPERGRGPHSALVERPDPLPTYDHIRSAFNHLDAVARRGDSAYIHFSGHGVRTKPLDTNTAASDWDFALVVLASLDGSRVRYIRSLELAHLLKRLVDKGLVVTLVLDCCFLGGLSRDAEPQTIRCMEYDHEIDAAYTIDPDIHHSIMWKEASGRDASIVPDWILNPQGYTILTACGPHEVAKEIVAEGQRHGALSFLLLHTLKKPGSDSWSHNDIYNQIAASFTSRYPTQHPAFYGHKNLSVFGLMISSAKDTPETIVRRQNSGICIQAGQAHGVARGDLWELYPANTTDKKSLNDAGRCFRVLVSAAGPLTSTVKSVDNNVSLGAIRTGFRARLVTAVSLQQFAIRLSPNLPDIMDWQTVAKQHTALNITCTDSKNTLFWLNVDRNDQHRLEISDLLGSKLPNLPNLLLNTPSSVQKGLHIVEHLTRYNHVRNISHEIQSNSFKSSYDIKLFGSSGLPYNETKPFELQETETIHLEVRNTGKQAIYIYVYTLGPFWQIENLQTGNYVVLPPRDLLQGFLGTYSACFEFAVPEELVAKGVRKCRDFLKVFLTNHPTNFGLLEMPRIDWVSRSDQPPTLSVEGCSAADQEPGEQWVAVTYEIYTVIGESMEV